MQIRSERTSTREYEHCDHHNSKKEEAMYYQEIDFLQSFEPVEHEHELTGLYVCSVL